MLPFKITSCVLPFFPHELLDYQSNTVAQKKKNIPDIYTTLGKIKAISLSRLVISLLKCFMGKLTY